MTRAFSIAIFILALGAAVASAQQPTADERKKFEDALTAFDAHDYDRSFALYAELSRNWTGAQFYLALHYLTGSGTPKDEKLGVEWLRRSAEGFPMSGRMLAGAHMLGLYGLARDREAALRVLDKAAAMGDADAKGMIAVLNMPPSRLAATRKGFAEYSGSAPPGNESEHDSFGACMEALGNWALRAGQHVFIMVPLEEAEDRFVGALMGPAPPFAETGESYWECRGGRLRLWF